MQTASISDNISDVLVRIIQFTQLRRRVLHQNLHQTDHPDFTPQDMPVREFAEAMNVALAEHLQNHRLLFRDTPNIKFGPNNAMEVRPMADLHAQALWRTNRDEYTELQISKLLENCLNRRIADELLQQKGDTGLGVLDGSLGQLLMGPSPLGESPANRDTAD